MLVKLGEVVDVLDKRRVPLSSKEREKRKGEYRYYGAQGVIDYVDDYLFSGQYLLIAEDGENLKSLKQNIAQIVEGKFWVNNHAHILASNGKSDIRYLCYLINSMDISGYITGSAQPKLNQANMNSIELELPELETQIKIADFLSLLDKKINLNNRLNANLEDLVSTIFKSNFIDFNNETEFVETEFGRIPKGWRYGTFSDIIESTLGGDWGKENPTGNYKEEVYCIRGADIPEIKIGNKGKMPIRYILSKNYLAKGLSKENLVIEISGGSPTQSTGRIAYISSALLERYEKGMVCTNFCRAVKPQIYYSSFIYYYWQYLYDKGVMFSYENGTTGIKNFDINSFINNEPIILPVVDKVKAFNEAITDANNKIYASGLENEKLCDLRDLLLPRLMAGEIDLS